jgi:hypothetical protein
VASTTLPRRPFSALPDDLLRFAVAVPVGGVDEVDSEIQRLVDDADAVVVIGVGHAAEHHRAQAIGADLNAGLSKRAVLHGVLLLRRLSAPRGYVTLRKRNGTPD